MKNKKVAAFAVLSVLALGIGGVATISSSYNSYANLVEAEEAAACGLVYDKTNAPKLVNGAGNAISGVTEISITKGENVANKFVGLKAKGSITQSNRIWDGTLGGKINGITSITVTFKNNVSKTKVPNPYYDVDPYEQPEFIEEDGATLRFRAYADGKQCVSNVTVVSGQKIVIADKAQNCVTPNEFLLVADSNASDANLPSGLIEIERIDIECTMEQHFGVDQVRDDININALEYLVLDASGNVTHRDTYDDVNFAKGERFGIKFPEDSNQVLFDEDLVLTNVKHVDTKTFAGDKKETFIMEPTGEGKIGIRIKHIRPLLYEGRSFVGTYHFVDPLHGQTMFMSLDKYGFATVNVEEKEPYEITYSADAKDNLTFTDKDKSIMKIVENVAYFKTSIYEYIGMLSNKPITFEKETRSASLCVGNISDGVSTKRVAFVHDVLLVEGSSQNVTISLYGGDTINNAKGYIIRAKKTSGESVITGIDKAVYETTIDGVTYDELRFTYPSSPSIQAPSKIKGTYAGELGDLVIDGFDTYKLGTTETGTYTYNSDNKVVNAGDHLLIIDTTAYTYKVKQVVTTNPWLKTSMSYKAATKNTILTFDATHVTLESDDSNWNPNQKVAYTFDKGIVSFTFVYHTSEGGWEFDNDVKFELEVVDATAKELKITKDIAVDAMTTLIKKTDSFVYFEQQVAPTDPWATTTAVYSGTIGTFTFNNGKVTIDIKNLKTTVKYTIVDNIVAFNAKYSITNMCGDSSGTAKFEFTLSVDKSTITSNKSITAEWYDPNSMDPTPIYTESIIKSGETFKLG